MMEGWAGAAAAGGSRERPSSRRLSQFGSSPLLFWIGGLPAPPPPFQQRAAGAIMPENVANTHIMKKYFGGQRKRATFALSYY